MQPLIVNNEDISRVLKSEYNLGGIRFITNLLESKGVFLFPALKTGLFSAAVLEHDKDYTGYASVWVRDNIYVAFAHFIYGKESVAIRTLEALMAYFKKHRQRFLTVISSPAQATSPMNRPHVRFDGNNLEELPEEWPHAQNDALGYFLWLYSKLACDGLLKPSQGDIEMLSLFARFFESIHYWEDEDSGHWEEVRKTSASSIGVVLAGLQQLKILLVKKPGALLSPEPHNIVDSQFLDSLIGQGKCSLHKILPEECVQADPKKRRQVDASLLFLIFPLTLVEGDIASQILHNVIANLQGDYGIRRYLGDSYWAPDYKEKLPPQERTRDFSENISFRDTLLPARMLEAQWCIFDPIVSCIFGMQFLSSGKRSDLDQQTFYLNRALGQITGEKEQPEIPAFRCPELYYLSRGKYVPNDHVPLLWTQANLLVALKVMERSCSQVP